MTRASCSSLPWRCFRTSCTGDRAVGWGRWDAEGAPHVPHPPTPWACPRLHVRGLILQLAEVVGVVLQLPPEVAVLLLQRLHLPHQLLVRGDGAGHLHPLQRLRGGGSWAAPRAAPRSTPAAPTQHPATPPAPRHHPGDPHHTQPTPACPGKGLVAPQSLPEGASSARGGRPATVPRSQPPPAPAWFPSSAAAQPAAPSPFVSLLSSPSPNHRSLRSLP